MKADALEKQITGEPIMVAIGGISYRLEYRFAAIIAFQEVTGDSLFNREIYPRIDLVQDPKRWLACLWAGLHQQQDDESWKAPFSFQKLSGMINLDPDSAGRISIQMVKALMAYFPSPPVEAVPNAAAPGELAQKTSPASPASTPGPELASELPGEDL